MSLPIDAGLTLVVPLFNERLRFPARAPTLVDWIAGRPGDELTFVDDGSSDGTPDLVRDFLAARGNPLVRLLERPHLGKGAAVQAGLEAATTPYAAFCDIDLATPLTDVGQLVAAAGDGRTLVVGSRDVRESTLVRHESRGREALGKAFNWAVRMIAVPGVADTQCGAKAAATVVWRELLPHLRERGFAWDVELLAVANRLGVPIREIGVSWAHDDDSRVRVLYDGAAMVRALPRIRLRSHAAARAVRPTATPAGAGPADRGGVFDATNAAQLATGDASHWWFRSKARLVSAQLARYGGGGGRLVDLGAGAGGVTAMLDWSGDIVGIEGNEELTNVALRRGLAFQVADIAEVPLPAGSAQAVCLLDVLEHLPEVDEALGEARRLLSANGRLVVTVPAHRWLWSAADVALGHQRRYTRSSLREHLELNGFEVLVLTHVFSYLVPPVWLKRKLLGGPRAELGLDVSSPAIAAIAVILTRAEIAVTRFASLPYGTSVLAVAVPRPTLNSTS